MNAPDPCRLNSRHAGRWIPASVLAIAFSAVWAASAGQLPDLREAVAEPAFADVVRPSNDELRWMEIDWQTDLMQARRLAAAQGKPIFLWQMDGHPLGCV